MTGEAFWLDPLLVLLGGAALIVLVSVVATPQNSLLRQRLRFVCPVTHQPVSATTLQDIRSGKITEIKRCSGWRWAWRPCDRACLARLDDGTLTEIGLPMRRG